MTMALLGTSELDDILSGHAEDVGTSVPCYALVVSLWLREAFGRQ
jgi:hypothetical protein